MHRDTPESAKPGDTARIGMMTPGGLVRKPSAPAIARASIRLFGYSGF